MIEEKLMNTKEAAAYLGIGLRTLQGWIHDGKYPAQKILKIGGKLVRFKKEDLDEWLETQRGSDQNG